MLHHPGPGQVESWTERTAGAIEAAGRGYAWPGNLRDLKKFTAAYVVSGGHEPAPAGGTAVQPVQAAQAARPAAEGSEGSEGRGEPESVCESSGLLGPNAKAGRATVDALVRDLVTRAFADTNQNISKTALRAGIDRKTVLQKIDPVRLARLLKKGPKKK
jgi:DNA-binding NtrC family response regulator